MRKKEYFIEVGGKRIIAEFTDLAENANGSVLVRSGDTAVLVTAVMSKNEEGMDYLPLTVDYEERFYAAGKILGSSFVRREGKPADEAILSGRIVDRTIRPLFDQRIRNEIQVVALILALGEDNPDILAVLGASLALGASDIPWNGPVSAVRIVKDDAALDLIACGKDNAINMIEVGGKEIEEKTVVAALEEAQKEIVKLQAWQEKIIKEIGKEKRKIEFPKPSKEIAELFEKEVAQKIHKAVFSGHPGHKTIDELKDEWFALVKNKLSETPGAKAFADAHFEDEVNNLLHKGAIESGERADGRGMDELRPLFAQAGGLSQTLHGTGIFYRGGTHILSVLTLGGPKDAQTLDTVKTHGAKKHFMHHYNFPPFSTGETGKLGGKNRRMIGHGALAEKALAPVIPSQEKFPYTIRLVSEALSSNGSTSMGSVCGATLALMDGGVSISAPVAGIASGLMLGKNGKYKILTDIQGPEDHHGDMDLKVAGTRKGITAVQMDVKVDGVPIHILAEALEKAKTAREKILDVIEKEIAAPRAEISPVAPKILIIQVKKEQIGLVIGGGGKTINEIKEKTGVNAIDIEDDGRVFITGKNGTSEKAAAVIKHLIQESENRWGRR
ncbi:MAG: polyribonucleotide nucleotidyltransferase [Parcubacteria group bacterium Gr01-1014_17]|nr:MAG: polyribonucleotide nucleotidyltransferase [Parcubacteria group bacterium Gr01-1014_17]